MTDELIEAVARQQIRERIARASTPRVRSRNGRQQLAARLRRVADRIDN
jgi:hypothetical protein